MRSLLPLALVKGSPMPQAWAETSGGRFALSLSKGRSFFCTVQSEGWGFDKLSLNGLGGMNV